jgi:hypothetical protein
LRDVPGALPLLCVLPIDLSESLASFSAHSRGFQFTAGFLA